MLRYHMAVISPDTRLRREIKRVTTATGASAAFLRDASELAEAGNGGGENPGAIPIDLAIIDARDPGRTPPTAALSALGDDARIAYIVAGEQLLARLDLLRDERVTSLMCRDDQFDDDEFIASATKALRGEVFGLQKYFPWGVTTFSMVARNYTQRERAMAMVMEFAQLAGVRGGIRQRIQLVCDELSLNALYHAPRDEAGEERFRNLSHKELRSMPSLPPIQIQYGCSGRYFGISVRDGAGSLTRPRLLQYVERARSDTMAVEQKTTGAGLGLASVVRSVSKLVFNLAPTESTEVVALFDMDLMARGTLGARSLHVFAVEPEFEPDSDAEPDDDDAPDGSPGTPGQAASDAGLAAIADTESLTRPSLGVWALVTMLLVVVSVLATAYVFSP